MENTNWKSLIHARQTDIRITAIRAAHECRYPNVSAVVVVIDADGRVGLEIATKMRPGEDESWVYETDPGLQLFWLLGQTKYDFFLRKGNCEDDDWHRFWQEANDSASEMEAEEMLEK